VKPQTKKTMKKVSKEVRTKEQIIAAVYAGEPVTVAELKTLNIGLIEAFESDNMSEEGFRAVQIDRQLVKNYEANYLSIPLLVLPAEELVETKSGFWLDVIDKDTNGKDVALYKDGEFVKDGNKTTLDIFDIVVTAGRRRLSSLFTFGKKDTTLFFKPETRAAVNMSNDAISINSASEFSKLWGALKNDVKLDIGNFLKTLNVKDTSEAGTGANKKTNMSRLVSLLQHLETSDSVKFERIKRQVFTNNFGYNALKNLLLFLTPEQRNKLVDSVRYADTPEYLDKLGELITKWFDYCESTQPVKYGITKGAKFDKFIELVLPAPPKIDDKGKIEKFSSIKPLSKIVLEAVATTDEQEQLHGSIHKYIMSLPMTEENTKKLAACYDNVKGAYKTNSAAYNEFLEGAKKWHLEKQATKEKTIFNTIFKETTKEGATNTELNSTFEMWLKTLNDTQKELLLGAILSQQKKPAAVTELNDTDNF
jgi:hypothetical protein